MFESILFYLKTFISMILGNPKIPILPTIVENIDETETDTQPNLCEILTNAIDEIESLPNEVKTAGKFSELNYASVVTRYKTLTILMGNLNEIIRNIDMLVQSPMTYHADFDNFISITTSSSSERIIADFLVLNGSYTSLQEIIPVIKSNLINLLTMLSKLYNLQDVNENHILFIERMVTPSIEEIYLFISGLNKIGCTDGKI